MVEECDKTETDHKLFNTIHYSYTQGNGYGRGRNVLLIWYCIILYIVMYKEAKQMYIS